EEEAERDPDERRVQRVGELAGVAPGHFPGHLVAGPGLGHLPRLRVDHRQRVLVVAFEPADFPLFVLEGRAGEQVRVLPALLDDLRVLFRCGGRRRGADVLRPRFFLPGRARGRRGDQGEDDERGEQRREEATRHTRPKWARIAGATSRRVHCSRSSSDSGPQPTKSNGPRLSPACSAPWLPPPAWLVPPQSTASKPAASESTKSPECGAVSADQTRCNGSG